MPSFPALTEAVAALRAFPGFVSFDSPGATYEAEERTYKLEAARQVRAALTAHPAGGSLARGNWCGKTHEGGDRHEVLGHARQRAASGAGTAPHHGRSVGRSPRVETFEAMRQLSLLAHPQDRLGLVDHDHQALVARRLHDLHLAAAGAQRPKEPETTR